MKVFVVSIIALILAGCNEENDSLSRDKYTFDQPANFPPSTYTFNNNPVTKAGFELGRVLFYDPILSADSTIACANCHQQARSFSDPVHRFSKGVNDVSGIRNAPAIQNMAFQEHFFWDGGVNHLDFVPINAITSEVEMAETLSNVIEKLQRRDSYRERFKNAFGESDINSQQLLHALSQFMNLMVSSNSRYDKYIRQEGGTLTSNELKGLVLFQTKCNACHATDLFTDGSFRNNGLNETFDQDSGRQRVTEHLQDRGKFKVPSLRNAELTSPYMHDGRFKTLEETLNHYAMSVKDSETLDPILKKGATLGIELTGEEKENIILFIKTLTDWDFTKDKKFSAPILN